MWGNSKRRWIFYSVTTLLLLWGSVFVYRLTADFYRKEKIQELRKVVLSVDGQIRQGVTTAEEMLFHLRGILGIKEIDSVFWKRFLESSEISGRYSNLFSFGYAERVENDNLKKFVEDMKKDEGKEYDKYTVSPSLETAEHFPIKYLSTKDESLKSLLGFDLRSLEDRVEAMTKSVKSGEVEMIGPLNLNRIVPGVNKEVMEIYLPVFADTTPENSQNIKEVKGFVVSWVSLDVMKNLMSQHKGVRYVFKEGDREIFAVGEIGENKIWYKDEFDYLGKMFVVDAVSDNEMKLVSYYEFLPVLVSLGLLIVNMLWLSTVVLDIYSRRRSVKMVDDATAELKKFKLAVDGVSEHVIISDSDAKVIYANRAAESITGYSAKEMVGSTPRLWGGLMPEKFYRDFWHTIKDKKESFYGEIRNRRKNGEIYEAEIRVSPILDEQGEILFFVGIERDLSKLKALEKMKSEFLSLASHQLRTPLSAVKWFTEMLLNGDAGKLNKEQINYLQKIDESNEREIRLVNSLLSVSRIESGRIAVNPKPVNIYEIIDDVVGDVKVEIGSKDKTIVAQLDRKGPTVEVDVDLIKHVFANILTNAVKYSDSGAKIVIKSSVRKNDILISIADNGIGIPKDDQGRIFNKFFRAGNALRKITDGNGLGLYLTKIIVESSGGKIWFESIEGEGTTFYVSLPVKRDK